MARGIWGDLPSKHYFWAHFLSDFKLLMIPTVYGSLGHKILFEYVDFSLLYFSGISFVLEPQLFPLK